MKKALMTVAVLTCAASVVSAQTVTSANIVGYNKDVGAAGSFHISGVQFDLGTAAVPSAVFGDQLPVGTAIYAFNGATYDIATYIAGYDASYNPINLWSPDTLDLSSGSGFWVENAGGSPIEAIISGEVPMAATATNSISAGFQLLSYPYPVAVEIQDMGFTPTIGDAIYVFNGATYDIATYIAGYDASYNPIELWSPATLKPAVGEGFWYETTTPATWVAPRTFTP